MNLLEGEDIPGELVEVPLNRNMARNCDLEKDLCIYVWDSGPGMTSMQILSEGMGNKRIHLTAQYYYRYDHAQSWSTSSGDPPVGDHHLFAKQKEIAAWNDAGKARHGFPAGTRVPKKAFDALRAKYGDLCGLQDPFLEHLNSWVRRRLLLLEGSDSPPDIAIDIQGDIIS